MKKYTAIAALEFKDISIGMHATDALLKKSPIGFLKCGTISRGRYMTLFGGSTASVDEAYQEGLFWGRDNLIDHVMLADVHPQVHDAIFGKRKKGGEGAMVIIETGTVSSNIRAAELALKGTTVDLIELRLADSELSGKGVSIYQGELYDVEAAVDIVLTHLREKNVEVTHKIITMPHEALSQQVEFGTFFGSSKLQELDGEIV